jgi:hypothetical protein
MGWALLRGCQRMCQPSKFLAGIQNRIISGQSANPSNRARSFRSLPLRSRLPHGLTSTKSFAIRNSRYAPPKIRFAFDSPLEEDGFEPSVPPLKRRLGKGARTQPPSSRETTCTPSSVSVRHPRSATAERPFRKSGIDGSNPVPSSGESSANLTLTIQERSGALCSRKPYRSLDAPLAGSARPRTCRNRSGRRNIARIPHCLRAELFTVQARRVRPARRPTN